MIYLGEGRIVLAVKVQEDTQKSVTHPFLSLVSLIKVLLTEVCIILRLLYVYSVL